MAIWDLVLGMNPGEYGPLFHLERAQALAQLGRHEEAVAAARSLAEAKDTPKAYFFEISAVFSLAMLAVEKDPALSPEEKLRLGQQYSAWSVGMLLKSAAPGLFKDAKQPGSSQ